MGEKVTQLPSATAINLTDILMIVQGGVSKQVPVSKLPIPDPVPNADNADKLDGHHWSEIATAIAAGLQVPSFAATQVTNIIDVSANTPETNAAPSTANTNFVVSATITPKKANSKLVIRGSLFGGWAGDGGRLLAGIFLDSAVNPSFVKKNKGTSSGDTAELNFEFVTDAGNTTARTYNLRCGACSPNGSHCYLNGSPQGGALYTSLGTVTFTVTEIFTA